MTQNLGRAISILLEPHYRHQALAADLRAFYAPSECYVQAFRDCVQQERQALRHACHVAGVKNRRLLRKVIRARIGNDAPIYRKYGFVPY